MTTRWLIVGFAVCAAVAAACATEDPYAPARERMMVRDLEGRGVSDPAVLAAMRKVPRHEFVLPRDLAHAYADTPLPIGEGQTISQPYIVAAMTEMLKLDRESVVLEIGTGSGYQAAICAEIAREVYTIEIIETLAAGARARLEALGYAHIEVRAGDGYYGWKEHAPFDAIIVTAAASHIPPPLVEQLKTGGRMVIPVGAAGFVQNLVLVEKKDDGSTKQRSVMPVRFVPLTGGH
ncbi:MAG: protein-L-isoaspartate(D-aspartate) O-methyltransferase [Kiritimatiellae bacterium]|nr:protein-L-isoaspartate(D-aspartate) O-methyltransferase [Kiritimatiellia bacterium]